MSCESGLCVYIAGSRYLCIVLGVYLHILGAPSVQSYCTLSISDSYRVFVLSDLDLSRHHLQVDLLCLVTI